MHGFILLIFILFPFALTFCVNYLFFPSFRHTGSTPSDLHTQLSTEEVVASETASEAHEEDDSDVQTRFPLLFGKLERITDTKKSFKGHGHRHENTSCKKM